MSHTLAEEYSPLQRLEELGRATQQGCAMALRSGQGQRKKYLTMDLSNLSTFVRNLRAVVSEFQFAKIGAHR